MTHTGRRCVGHAYHSPRPARSDIHHVVPIGWGGPEDKANRVPLCQTGHANVHLLLDFYKDFNGSVPWPIRREFGPGERKIAAEGWRRYQIAQSVATSEQQG